MSKAVSRSLFLIGLGVVILYYVVLVVSQLGGAANVSPFWNPVLFDIVSILYSIGVLLIFIAYIGALVKTARLGRWGWFVCLLLFTFVTMLIYIFAGPEIRPGQPVVASYPQPGFSPQGYPQTNNPYLQGYPSSGFPQQGSAPGGYRQPGDQQGNDSPSDYLQQ